MLIFCLNSGSFWWCSHEMQRESLDGKVNLSSTSAHSFINQTFCLPAFCVVEPADVCPHRCQHSSTQFGPSSRCSQRHWSWGLGSWLASKLLLGIGRLPAGLTMSREQVRWRRRKTQNQDNMATYQHCRFHVINNTKDALMDAVSTLILRHNTEKPVDPRPQLLMLLR